jgi:GNAT superfamily N-acetyltransferase
MPPIIRPATPEDSPAIARLVGELLNEIMGAIGVQTFNFDLAETIDRLHDFLSRDKYFAFVARDDTQQILGFTTLYESYALYAEGAFGTIAELYVRPEYRSLGIGHRLVSQATQFAQSRGWRRLEVTTPPLPPFDKTLAFYEREGFIITGGRKLKRELPHAKLA